MAKEKLHITKRAYLHFPVANGSIVKREFAKLGYQIADIQFAPPGYTLPKELHAIVAAGEPTPWKSPAPAKPAAKPAAQTEQPPAQPVPAAASAAAPADSALSLQPAATGESAEKAATSQPATAQTQTETPKPAEQSAGKTPETMTDAELRDAIEVKSGSKPAWNAKRETLIAQLTALG